MARFGINIEQVSALRSIGRNSEADPVTAAIHAEIGGCDGIVCPVREGMQPVTERDVRLLRELVKTHLNIQIPPVEDMIHFALGIKPDMITIIPGEKPMSSSGGGLNILGHAETLMKMIHHIRSQNIIVSVLVDSEIQQIKAAARAGVDYVEINASEYAAAESLNERADQLERLKSVALGASKIGLGVAVSQGLDYHNIADITAISTVEEVNIGHAVVGRALWVGMEAAVRDMGALVK